MSAGQRHEAQRRARAWLEERRRRTGGNDVGTEDNEDPDAVARRGEVLRRAALELAGVEEPSSRADEAKGQAVEHGTECASNAAENAIDALICGRRRGTLGDADRVGLPLRRARPARRDRRGAVRAVGTGEKPLLLLATSLLVADREP